MDKTIIVDFGLLPLIGAFHGWLTNVVALRLLFRPANEVNILGLRFQGLLHKRQAEIAESIGEIVETELLRFDDIRQHLTQQDTLAAMSAAVSRSVAGVVNSRLPKMLPPPLRNSISSFLEDRLSKEVAPIIQGFLDDNSNAEFLRGRVGPIVAARIKSFNVDELEGITRKAVGRELKSIENLGFTMGLAIGLVQGVFLTILRATSFYN